MDNKNEYLNVYSEQGKECKSKDGKTFKVYRVGINKERILQQFDELGAEWINFNVWYSKDKDKYYFKICPKKEENITNAKDVNVEEIPF